MEKTTPKFTTVSIAGLICFIISALFIINQDLSFLSSSKNQALFATHGSFSLYWS